MELKASPEMAAAALIALARFNIPPDVQELLVRGDPMRNIPPGALDAAIAAGWKTERGALRAWLAKPRDGL